MDRIEFIASTKSSDSFENTVVELFDNIMAIYDLIGMAFKGMTILEVNKEKPSVTFSIAITSDTEAELIYNAVNNRIVYTYGHRYLVIPSRADVFLNIELIEQYEKASG